MRDAILQYGSKLSQLMMTLTGAAAINIVTRPQLAAAHESLVWSGWWHVCSSSRPTFG